MRGGREGEGGVRRGRGWREREGTKGEGGWSEGRKGEGRRVREEGGGMGRGRGGETGDRREGTKNVSLQVTLGHHLRLLSPGLLCSRCG